MPSRNLELLTTAATRLEPLLDKLVFVGGCATEVLISDPAAADVRETYDVDVIVEIGSLLEYYEFGHRLQALGFSEDSSEEAPRCRWKHGQLKLDVMPTDERVLGLQSRWFKAAMESAEAIKLRNDLRIRIVKASYFIATKLDAFKDRGKNDYRGSHDLEDLIAVIDGRPALLEELRDSPVGLREYVSSEIGKLLQKTMFRDALPGYLLPDRISQARIGRLLTTLDEMSRLAVGGRQHDRSLADGEVKIFAASAQATGALVDVSKGGLQILCRVPAMIGEFVEVRFTPEGFPEEVRAQGKIARIERDRVGIEFTQLSSWLPVWQRISAFYAVESRRDERYPTHPVANICVGPRQATKCEVVDVSQRGMQIRSDLPVSVGDAVDVRFTPGGQLQETTVTGRVARIQGDRIGISFAQVSAWQASWRKMVAFRTVSQKKQEGPLTAEFLIAKVAAIQKEAAASDQISVKTAALWKMESLGVTFGRIAQSGDTLSDPNLPVQARPIVHVGMGGAAVELANFDRAEITRIIDSLAHPDYRLFSYEQIGAMLGVYEKTVPRLMLGLKRLDRPDPEKFVPLFPREVRRLISHGYGRLLYFNSKDLQAAFENIRKRQFLDLGAAVQGMAFGYTMVNHNELGVVLETGDHLLEPALVKAFQAGLVYALEFWEWEAPGTLQSLPVSSARANDLLRIAHQEIAAARKQGYLDPFLVKSLSEPHRTGS
jgi:PilZ domain